MKRENPACCLPWREEGTYYAYVMLVWKDKWIERGMRAFYQRITDALRPWSIDSNAAHTNFPELSLAPDRYERAWYGKNLPKLREVKRTWDPDNYFDGEQGIKPRSPKRKKSFEGQAFGVNKARKEIEEDQTDKVASQQWDNHRRPPVTDWVSLHGIPYWWWHGLAEELSLSPGFPSSPFMLNSKRGSNGWG